jgi:two-component system alkaline phosphatase synthesis response regulator PhoP
MTKILVVDDDPDATMLIESILRTEGYEPITVNNSALAMEAASKSKPNLILLDLMMPEPNGFEVCRMLRSNPIFGDTPILIITAMDSSDSKAISILAGADDFLGKPFNSHDLVERIKALLH